MIVYVSIGNSDDKLSQAAWAYFIRTTERTLTVFEDTHVHGRWFSAPDSSYQNACWCVEFGQDDLEATVGTIKADLAIIAKRFGQDSIAWAEVKTTEFLTPLEGS